MANISRSHGIRSSSGLHIGMGISESASSLPLPIIAADWDNAGGYVPETQNTAETGMKLAGQRVINTPDAAAFTGATGVTVASTQGGIIGTVTIVSGRLTFDYTTPPADPDFLNIAGTDVYGRAFSFTKEVSLPY